MSFSCVNRWKYKLGKNAYMLYYKLYNTFNKLDTVYQEHSYRSTKNIHYTIFKSLFACSTRLSFLESTNSFLNFWGISKNVSTWLQNQNLWMWTCCDSVNLLVTQYKNMKNEVANFCNLWIKFETLNNL